MPPEAAEAIEDLERIPRAIVRAPRPWRIGLVGGLFVAGGALIYFTAEPFLASLLAVSAAIGVPNFIFVQWLAPFVSEFPEAVSAYYWARSVERAPMALMNLVSSNINQWTLLAAMLPIVFSLSKGVPAAIIFDSRQELELLMTLGQSLVGALFLINMELAWWEATALFALWLIQFLFSIAAPQAPIHWYVTMAYLVWAAVEIVRLFFGRRQPLAFRYFGEMWRSHVRGAP
jgi:cation:H+ antiporter